MRHGRPINAIRSGVAAFLLAAAPACAEAKIFAASADDFAKIVGTSVDQLKPLVPRVKPYVDDSETALRLAATAAERRIDDLVEVVCNDVFQAAVERSTLPSSIELIDALTDDGVPSFEASQVGSTLAAEALEAAGGFTTPTGDYWDRFLTYVGGTCEIKGALEQL